jgi:NADH-quinone oxidoreductase subunit M
MNLLSLMTLLMIPLVTAIVIALFIEGDVATRRFAKIVAVAHFVYSLFFLLYLNPSDGTYQVVQEMLNDGQIWISSLGISFSLAVDGVSLVMVILTSLITLLAIIASKESIKEKHKFYYSMIFLLEFAVLGVFLAKDLFLFFLFWELELIPMYFLISIWGTGRPKYSAMKFVLYTFFGSLFMLASILAVYYCHFMKTGSLTMDMSALSLYNGYPALLQFFAFIGFFIAFAVKFPIVPLHNWLPDAHVDAPTPVSMLLAGILLKMGAYGLIRINLYFFPSVFNFFAPMIFVLGIINILYAAFIALAQTDLKKLIAYSSISHMGIVLVGLCAMNAIGVSGAVAQMIAHGLISAGLFMVVGVIYHRTKTRDIEKLGGLAQKMPVLYYLSIIFGLGSVGLPGLIGFVGEALCFFGSAVSDAFLAIQIFTGIALLGAIAGAVYITSVLKRVFCGVMLDDYNDIEPIQRHELVVLFSLALLIVVFGMFPHYLVNIFSLPIDSFFSV